MYADDFYSDSPPIRMQSNAFGNFCDAGSFLRINIEITAEVLERKRPRARFDCAFACILNFREKKRKKENDRVEAKVRDEGRYVARIDRESLLYYILFHTIRRSHCRGRYIKRDLVIPLHFRFILRKSDI